MRITKENLPVKKTLSVKILPSEDDLKKEISSSESVKEDDNSTSIDSSVSKASLKSEKYFDLIPKKTLWIGSGILALSIISFVLYKKFKK